MIPFQRCGLIFGIAALLLAGCHHVDPVYNVNARPTHLQTPSNLTEQAVGEAITRALAKTGWKVDIVKPGYLLATIQWGNHSASVDINYDKDSFSIVLNSSHYLNEKDGEIHPTYNKYIVDLESAIRTELGMQGPPPLMRHI
jgi:hypothetical protein